MKLKLPRRRWLLLIACLAAIGWWQFGPRERYTRKQFDRVRLGMTPAEVASCIGSAPLSRCISVGMTYEQVSGIMHEAGWHPLWDVRHNSPWDNSLWRDSAWEDQLRLNNINVSFHQDRVVSHGAFFHSDGIWESAAQEGHMQITGFGEEEAWGDEYAVIRVYYDSHGRAALKMMEAHVPHWKAKAREWLEWLDVLRGLVGVVVWPRESWLPGGHQTKTPGTWPGVLCVAVAWVMAWRRCGPAGVCCRPAGIACTGPLLASG
jgi:hypothetical protein